MTTQILECIYSSIDPRRADANYKCITYNYIYIIRTGRQRGKGQTGRRVYMQEHAERQRNRDKTPCRHPNRHMHESFKAGIDVKFKGHSPSLCGVCRSNGDEEPWPSI